jgi:hypothetical protein
LRSGWRFGKQKERQISEFRFQREEVGVREAEGKANFRVQISEGGGGGSGSRRKGKFQSSGFQREEVGAGCGGGTCG